MSKNTAKKFGYARVSSTSQNLDRQIDSLQEYVSSERDIFCDKASGKNFEREEYQRLKGYLREGDELYVHSLDRLGRNKEQVLEELRYFSSAGIRVRILDLPTTMTEMPDGQSWILDMINNGKDTDDIILEKIKEAFAGFTAWEEENHAERR